MTPGMVLGIVLLPVLVAALVDLAAIVQGWWRSRTIYTLLALGHDGKLSGMAYAAHAERAALLSALQSRTGWYKPEHWRAYRDNAMWYFVQRRVERQLLRAMTRLTTNDPCLICGGPLNYQIDGVLQRTCWQCSVDARVVSTLAGSVKRS